MLELAEVLGEILEINKGKAMNFMILLHSTFNKVVIWMNLVQKTIVTSLKTSCLLGLGQQLMTRFGFQNGGRCRDRRGCTGSENILKKLLIIFKVALIGHILIFGPIFG